MIQRIQSIYLFISFLLIAGFFISPIANYVTSESVDYELNVYSLQNVSDMSEPAVFDNYPIAVLAGAIALIFLVSIFLYKNRVLQARLCIINILLVFGLAGLLYFYSEMGKTELIADISYGFINIALPLVLVLSFIAHKRIRLDEALVKSYDRIR